MLFMQSLCRKKEASGLLGTSRPAKAFALSILQFEFCVLLFKDFNTSVFKWTGSSPAF